MIKQRRRILVHTKVLAGVAESIQRVLLDIDHRKDHAAESTTCRRDLVQGMTHHRTPRPRPSHAAVSSVAMATKAKISHLLRRILRNNSSRLRSMPGGEISDDRLCVAATEKLGLSFMIEPRRNTSLPYRCVPLE